MKRVQICLHCGDNHERVQSYLHCGCNYEAVAKLFTLWGSP